MTLRVLLQAALKHMSTSIDSAVDDDLILLKRRESICPMERALELEIPSLLFHDLINTSSIDTASVLNVME